VRRPSHRAAIVVLAALGAAVALAVVLLALL